MLKGTIEFPVNTPSSAELVIELKVTEIVSGDAPNKVVLTEAIRIFNFGQSVPFEIPTHAGLPRTSRLNDAPGEKTAKWAVTVTGSDGARDCVLTWMIEVFEAPGEPNPNGVDLA